MGQPGVITARVSGPTFSRRLTPCSKPSPAKSHVEIPLHHSSQRQSLSTLTQHTAPRALSSVSSELPVSKCTLGLVANHSDGHQYYIHPAERPRPSSSTGLTLHRLLASSAYALDERALLVLDVVILVGHDVGAGRSWQLFSDSGCVRHFRALHVLISNHSPRSSSLAAPAATARRLTLRAA